MCMIKTHAQTATVQPPTSVEYDLKIYTWHGYPYSKNDLQVNFTNSILWVSLLVTLLPTMEAFASHIFHDMSNSENDL